MINRLDVKTMYENVSLVRSAIRGCICGKVSRETLTMVLELAGGVLCDVENELFDAGEQERETYDVRK